MIRWISSINGVRSRERQFQKRILAEALIAALFMADFLVVCFDVDTTQFETIPITYRLLIYTWPLVFIWILPDIVTFIDSVIVTSMYSELLKCRAISEVRKLSDASDIRRFRIKEYQLAASLSFVSVVCLISGSCIVCGTMLMILTPIFIDYIYAYQPPLALLLGTSTHESLQLQQSLSYAIFPLRAVSFFDIGNASDLKKKVISADIFRVVNDSSWKTNVEVGLLIAPIIIINARNISSAVLEELKLVRKLGIEYKVAFVVDELQTPTFNVGIYIHKGAITLNEWMLPGFIWYLTYYTKTTIKPNNSLNKMLAKYREIIAFSGANGSEAIFYLEKLLDRNKIGSA